MCLKGKFDIHLKCAVRLQKKGCISSVCISSAAVSVWPYLKKAEAVLKVSSNAMTGFNTALLIFTVLSSFSGCSVASVALSKWQSLPHSK